MKLLLFCMIFVCGTAVSQSTESIQIKNSDFYRENCLDYNPENCNKAETTIELRICLSIEFLFLDSILSVVNKDFLDYLNEDDQLDWNKIHDSWLSLRRKQAEFFSINSLGESAMIQYLNSLIILTNQRIEFLKSLVLFYKEEEK